MLIKRFFNNPEAACDFAFPVDSGQQNR